MIEVKRAVVTDSEQMALSQVIKQGWPTVVILCKIV